MQKKKAIAPTVCPSFSLIKWLCVSDHWLPSSMVSHHTSALCASCFWLLSANNRGKQFGAVKWPDFNEKQTSVLINETRSHCSCLEDWKITGLTPLTEVVYSQTNTTWNSDQQTFLNPNAAPLCQLYARLLKDSAELLSSWCCHRDFSSLPKLLLRHR